MTGNGTIVVYFAEQDLRTSVVPNLSGLSPSQANEVIAGAGLNIRLTGTFLNPAANVISQSIEPGTEVPSGTVIEVDFLFVDGYAG